MDINNLLELENSWTAEVKLKNDIIITIWWTAIYTSKDTIKEIISVSSDYPRFKLSDSNYLKSLAL